MEDHIVYFVVAVDEGASVTGLGGFVREEGYHVVEVGEFTDWFFGVGVLDLGLGFGDGCEGCDLAVEEAAWFAKGFKADCLGDNAVKFREGFDCILPSALVSIFHVPCARLS